MRRVIARVGLLAVGVILVVAPTAGGAVAHTAPVALSPKKGAILTKAPARVTIAFGEEIRGGSIVVRDAAGSIVSRGTNGKHPSDVRRLRVGLKAGLGSGKYSVRWLVEAADGHEQRGSYSFRVR